MGCIGPNNFRPNMFVDLNVATPEEGSAHMCERHTKKKAVKLLIGACDGMGSEYTPVCQKCINYWEKYFKNIPEENKMSCEKCDSKDDVVPTRDPEEGMAGPLYYWCASCRKDFWKSWNEQNLPDDDWRDNGYEEEEDYVPVYNRR